MNSVGYPEPIICNCQRHAKNRSRLHKDCFPFVYLLSMMKTKMSSSPAYPEDLRCILLDTIANLTPEESSSQGLHLTRLRAALGEFEAFISGPSPDLYASKPTNYLNSLPQRALENIIRHLSERPKSTKWERFIDSRDAHSLYCGEGPLNTLFRTQFPNVQINVDSKFSKPPPKPKGFYQAPPALRSPPSHGFPLETFAMSLSTRTWTSGAVEVLTAAGSSITSLSYTGDGDQDSPPHLVSWIDPFMKHCTSIKCLEIRKTSILFFRRIVEASAGILESLYLDSSSSSPCHLYQVSRHCIGLRQLSLPIYEPVSESLWKTVGPTLEELHFTLPCKPPPPPKYSPPPPPPRTPTFTVLQRRDVIKSIENNCRAIRRISVNLVEYSLRSSISSLLRSYGEQLEYAGVDFRDISPTDCRIIADTCPNAVFEVMTLTPMSKVRDLKFQFHSLRLVNLSLFDQTDMDIVGLNCNELRELDLASQDWKATYTVASLLCLPKPNLVELRLRLTEDNAIEVLHEIAIRTTTLRRFNLTLKILRSDGFADIFEANPHMQEVRINISSNTTASTTGTVVRVIEHCARLQNLRELIITTCGVHRWQSSILQTSADTAKIANACVPHRTKRTHVIVFGVDYL